MEAGRQVQQIRCAVGVPGRGVGYGLTPIYDRGVQICPVAVLFEPPQQNIPEVREVHGTVWVASCGYSHRPPRGVDGGVQIRADPSLPIPRKERTRDVR